jgi:TatD DNase family protein
MTQELQWIDTHCHVYEENIPGGQDHALQAARDAGVVTMIVIGTDADTTRQAIDIANMHPDVYATVGLHPHDADLITTTTIRIEQFSAKYLHNKYNLRTN